MSTTLNLTTPETSPTKGVAVISARKPKRLSVVEQVIHMFKSGGRIAAFLGMLTGGCIPVFTFFIAHRVLPFCRDFSFTFFGLIGVAMWAVGARRAGM